MIFVFLIFFIFSNSVFGMSQQIKQEINAAQENATQIEYSAKIVSLAKQSIFEKLEPNMVTLLDEIMQKAEINNLDKKNLLHFLHDELNTRTEYYRKEIANPANRKQLCATKWGLYKQIGLALAKIIGCAAVTYIVYRCLKSDKNQRRDIIERILPSLEAYNIYEGNYYATAIGPSYAQREIQSALTSLAKTNSGINEGYFLMIIGFLGTFFYTGMGFKLFEEIYAQEYYDRYSLVNRLIEQKLNHLINERIL